MHEIGYFRSVFKLYRCCVLLGIEPILNCIDYGRAKTLQMLHNFKNKYIFAWWFMSGWDVWIPPRFWPKRFSWSGKLIFGFNGSYIQLAKPFSFFCLEGTCSWFQRVSHEGNAPTLKVKLSEESANLTWPILGAGMLSKQLLRDQKLRSWFSWPGSISNLSLHRSKNCVKLRNFNRWILRI